MRPVTAEPAVSSTDRPVIALMVRDRAPGAGSAFHGLRRATTVARFEAETLTTEWPRTMQCRVRQLPRGVTS